MQESIKIYHAMRYCQCPYVNMKTTFRKGKLNYYSLLNILLTNQFYYSNT